VFQIRIHGRGGQGVVTAAELLSVAAFDEGRHAQAFPSFGSERTGAPVVAFCRIDDRPIRLREPIGEPDAIIVADPTLLGQIDVLAGLNPDGYVLLNSERAAADLIGAAADLIGGRVRPLRPGRVFVVPATRLAMEHVGRPVPNAALLGGFAAATGLVSLASVQDAIRDRFPPAVAEANVAAAAQAYHHVDAAQAYQYVDAAKAYHHVAAETMEPAHA
jgi:pyruvate ferredoxin oxidoreductase gamma subunit